jgi:predicted metalloprotease
VKYNEGARLDPSQVGGGGGNGGKIAIGGGAGLVVLVLALLLGVNPGDLLGSGSGSGADPGASEAASSPFAQCSRGSDIGQDRDCRFVAYTNSIQDYWSGVVPDYQVIKVTTFTGQVSTACGTATAEVGPFYCSGDTAVYLDLGFFDELTTKLGAKGGDAAEAYVLAHEFGHWRGCSAGSRARAAAPARRPRASGSSSRPTATPGCGSTTRRTTRAHPSAR